MGVVRARFSDLLVRDVDEPGGSLSGRLRIETVYRAGFARIESPQFGLNSG